jgi:hypothetical protein
MRPKEGRIVHEETFALGEEEFLEFELEILCMGEEEQAASFVGQQLEAACIPYLLERLHL